MRPKDQALVNRLRELSRAVGHIGKGDREDAEFYLSIPPRQERDADFVLARAADRIEELCADPAAGGGQ